MTMEEKTLFHNARYCKDCGTILLDSYTRDLCSNCEAQRIFDEKLSVRDTEKLVKSLQNEKKKQTDVRTQIDPKLEAIYQDLEEQMKVILGTKVSINHKDSEKGKLEIEYYSQDELDRIIDLLRTIQK